ncbi:MAG: PASTA domain-containing protein [Candidatus Nanopelagicales bacterium]
MTVPHSSAPQGKAKSAQGSPLSTPIWIAITVAVALLAGGLTWLITGRSTDEAPTSVTASSVVGFTIQEATLALEGQGLQVGEITLEPSDIETGRVLAQNPEAGTTLALGSRVDLVVAGDSEPRVPDVTSLNETEAVNALIAVGLQYEVSRTSSSEAAGEVISQTPSAGEQVPPGTVVSLVVSNGELGVPDVVGLTSAEARATLRNEGFRVKEQEVESDKVGIVLKQDPAPGTELALDSIVVLTVGAAKPEPTPTPEPASNAVCGNQEFARLVASLREPGDAPVQYIQDYTCVGGWAVVLAAVGDQPDQIVLERYIFEAEGNTWARVSEGDACASGSGLPQALRGPGCDPIVS